MWKMEVETVVMSSPVTLTPTFGVQGPIVTMTSSVSGTQRSVTMVGEHAQGEAINIFNFSQAGWLIQVELRYYTFK